MIKDHSRFQIHPDLAKLLDAHEAACVRANDAMEAMNRAQSDLHEARTNLGKWMVPADAKDGETFSVWLGSILFSVTLHKGYAAHRKRDGGEDQDIPATVDRYEITMRKGGKV